MGDTTAGQEATSASSMPNIQVEALKEKLKKAHLDFIVADDNRNYDPNDGVQTTAALEMMMHAKQVILACASPTQASDKDLLLVYLEELVTVLPHAWSRATSSLTSNNFLKEAVTALEADCGLGALFAPTIIELWDGNLCEKVASLSRQLEIKEKQLKQFMGKFNSYAAKTNNFILFSLDFYKTRATARPYFFGRLLQNTGYSRWEMLSKELNEGAIKALKGCDTSESFYELLQTKIYETNVAPQVGLSGEADVEMFGRNLK